VRARDEPSHKPARRANLLGFWAVAPPIRAHDRASHAESAPDFDYASPDKVAEPKPEWIEQIEQEHAQIRTLLATLEGKVGEDVQTTRSWGASVRATLETLVPLLQQHFSREEAALTPHAAASVFPKLAERLSVLNQHHPQLLAAFVDAKVACAVPALDPARAADIARRLRATIDALREHERAETELFALAARSHLDEAEVSRSLSDRLRRLVRRLPGR
jgi:ferritin-like protein